MDLHDAGVSFGKYRAYLILHDLDPSISLDDIRSMTMREIYDLVDSYDENQGTENAGTEVDEAETGTGTGQTAPRRTRRRGNRLTGFPFLLIHSMCHCQLQLTLHHLSHHLFVIPSGPPTL